MSGAWRASLSIVQLLVLAHGKREAPGTTPLPFTLLGSIPLLPMTAWFSFTGTSHHSLLPDIPLGHLLAVSSRPYPGMAPQSLPYSFQPLCLLRDPHNFGGCIWLWQGLSVILTPFRLPHINFFTLSLKCFSSEPNSRPDIEIGPLLQFPHLLRTGPVPLALLFPPRPFLCSTEFCVVLYILSLRPGTLAHSQLVMCKRVCVWRCISEVPVERHVLHVHLFRRHLAPPQEGFLSLLSILWNSPFRWVYFFLSPLPFVSLPFSAICNASSDNHFAYLHFSPLWVDFVHDLLLQCYELLSIVLQAQCLPELITWIYLSPPLYNLKEIDLCHIWRAKLFSLLSSI